MAFHIPYSVDRYIVILFSWCMTYEYDTFAYSICGSLHTSIIQCSWWFSRNFRNEEKHSNMLQSSNKIWVDTASSWGPMLRLSWKREKTDSSSCVAACLRESFMHFRHDWRKWLNLHVFYIWTNLFNERSKQQKFTNEEKILETTTFHKLSHLVDLPVSLCQKCQLIL